MYINIYKIYINTYLYIHTYEYIYSSMSMRERLVMVLDTREVFEYPI